MIPSFFPFLPTDVRLRQLAYGCLSYYYETPFSAAGTAMTHRSLRFDPQDYQLLSMINRTVKDSRKGLPAE